MESARRREAVERARSDVDKAKRAVVQAEKRLDKAIREASEADQRRVTTTESLKRRGSQLGELAAFQRRGSELGELSACPVRALDSERPMCMRRADEPSSNNAMPVAPNAPRVQFEAAAGRAAAPAGKRATPPAAVPAAISAAAARAGQNAAPADRPGTAPAAVLPSSAPIAPKAPRVNFEAAAGRAAASAGKRATAPAAVPAAMPAAAARAAVPVATLAAAPAAAHAVISAAAYAAPHSASPAVAAPAPPARSRAKPEVHLTATATHSPSHAPSVSLSAPPLTSAVHSHAVATPATSAAAAATAATPAAPATVALATAPTAAAPAMEPNLGSAVGSAVEAVSSRLSRFFTPPIMETSTEFGAIVETSTEFAGKADAIEPSAQFAEPSAQFAAPPQHIRPAIMEERVGQDRRDRLSPDRQGIEPGSPVVPSIARRQLPTVECAATAPPLDGSAHDEVLAAISRQSVQELLMPMELPPDSDTFEAPEMALHA